MSLEQAIQENTAAILALAELMRKPQSEAPKAEPQAKKTVAEKPAPTPPVPETATPTKAEAAPAEVAAASPTDDKPTLADLTQATTGAVTRNRGALVALIESYGVKRAGSIPEDKWAEFIAKAEAI